MFYPDIPPALHHPALFSNLSFLSISSSFLFSGWQSKPSKSPCFSGFLHDRRRVGKRMAEQGWHSIFICVFRITSFFRKHVFGKTLCQSPQSMILFCPIFLIVDFDHFSCVTSHAVSSFCGTDRFVFSDLFSVFSSCFLRLFSHGDPSSFLISKTQKSPKLPDFLPYHAERNQRGRWKIDASSFPWLTRRNMASCTAVLRRCFSPHQSSFLFPFPRSSFVDNSR